MSELKWRPVGTKPVIAGDVFGDFQVGDAYVVTYHLDECYREYRGEMIPTVRVSAYFGVENLPESATKQTVREGARYSPVSHVVFERLDHTGEDVIDEEAYDNGEVFPLDYSEPGIAMMDAEGVANEWQAVEWDVSDFWDGKDMPRD